MPRKVAILLPREVGILSPLGYIPKWPFGAFAMRSRCPTHPARPPSHVGGPHCAPRPSFCDVGWLPRSTTARVPPCPTRLHPWDHGCKLFALAPTGHGLRRRATASPLTCQTGPRAVGRPVVPQISMVGTGAGEQKLRPVLLAITGATATAAGIVARVSELSTSMAGGVVGLGGFAITATSLMKWWQERDETIENNAARVLLNSRVELPSSKKAALMPREQLAGEIRATLETTAYVIAGGPRGCGKSMGVVDSLSNVTAVLRVKMGVDIKAPVSIAEGLGIPSSFKLTEMRLRNILCKTATLMKQRATRPRPTRGARPSLRSSTETSR